MVFHNFLPNLTSKPPVLLHVASMCETRRSSAGSLRPQAPILHSSSAIRTASRCRSMLGGCGVASLRDLAQQVLMSGAPYGAPGFSIGKWVESIRHTLCLMVELYQEISRNIMKYQDISTIMGLRTNYYDWSCHGWFHVFPGFVQTWCPPMGPPGTKQLEHAPSSLIRTSNGSWFHPKGLWGSTGVHMQVDESMHTSCVFKIIIIIIIIITI